MKDDKANYEDPGPVSDDELTQIAAERATELDREEMKFNQLTPEQVPSLSDEQLDEACAVGVMGWHVCWFDRKYRVYEEGWDQQEIAGPDNAKHKAVDYWAENGTNNCIIEVAEFQPSRDIEAAKACTDKILRANVKDYQGYDLPAAVMEITSFQDEVWVSILSSFDNSDDWDVEARCATETRARAEASLLAALKMKEVNGTEANNSNDGR